MRKPNGGTRLALWSGLLPILLGLSLAGPASASLVTVSAGHNSDGGCLDASASASSGPVAVDTSCSGALIGGATQKASAFATADFGHLGVALDTELTASPFANVLTMGEVTASFSDTYVITGEVGSTVTTSLNFDLSGSLQTFCLIELCQNSAMARVAAGGVLTSGLLVTGEGATNQGLWNLAPLASGGGPLFLTTAPFTVWANTPFAVIADLTLGAFLRNGDPTGIGGRVVDDLSHTLTFHVGGPVFNLPDGYSASGGGVVDNRYGVAAPAGIPEPATVGLLLAGLAMLSRRRPARS